MSDLKPCPFCGGDDKLAEVIFNKLWHCIQCYRCNADGPLKDSREGANAAWNTRYEEKDNPK